MLEITEVVQDGEGVLGSVKIKLVDDIGLYPSVPRVLYKAIQGSIIRENEVDTVYLLAKELAYDVVTGQTDNLLPLLLPKPLVRTSFSLLRLLEFLIPKSMRRFVLGIIQRGMLTVLPLLIKQFLPVVVPHSVAVLILRLLLSPLVSLLRY
ncbi:hypothetical protein ANAPC5_01113 [Anaplasma phagocytophilum]|nr:hypothetical protein ANAPC5_01113 [Anaplasma phagocytophilum]